MCYRRQVDPWHDPAVLTDIMTTAIRFADNRMWARVWSSKGVYVCVCLVILDNKEKMHELFILELTSWLIHDRAASKGSNDLYKYLHAVTAVGGTEYFFAPPRSSLRCDFSQNAKKEEEWGEWLAMEIHTIRGDLSLFFTVSSTIIRWSGRYVPSKHFSYHTSFPH